MLKLRTGRAYLGRAAALPPGPAGRRRGDSGWAVPEAGCGQPEFQPGGDRPMVLTDPAGHPFCLRPAQAE